MINHMRDCRPRRRRRVRVRVRRRRHAQEVTGGATTTAKPMSSNLVPITQPMLDSGAERREELDPFERQLRPDALLPRQPDQRRQRRAS